MGHAGAGEVGEFVGAPAISAFDQGDGDVRLGEPRVIAERASATRLFQRIGLATAVTTCSGSGRMRFPRRAGKRGGRPSLAEREKVAAEPAADECFAFALG